MVVALNSKVESSVGGEERGLLVLHLGAFQTYPHFFPMRTVTYDNLTIFLFQGTYAEHRRRYAADTCLQDCNAATSHQIQRRWSPCTPACLHSPCSRWLSWSSDCKSASFTTLMVSLGLRCVIFHKFLSHSKHSRKISLHRDHFLTIKLPTGHLGRNTNTMLLDPHWP